MLILSTPIRRLLVREFDIELMASEFLSAQPLLYVDSEQVDIAQAPHMGQLQGIIGMSQLPNGAKIASGLTMNECSWRSKFSSQVERP